MLSRYDMHCHLSLMANGEAVAREAAERGIGILAVCVTPDDFARARGRFAGADNVRVGVGLHPWWIADGRCGGREVARLIEAARRARFVGEIGLDLGRRRASSREAQLDALSRLARCMRQNPVAGRVLSIHAVRSVNAVLDILERSGALEDAACIFHWFTGSSEELARARRAGCYFSVNEHMLATRRGREYARAIEQDRLLLETDAPPELCSPYAAGALATSLTSTLETIARLRGARPEKLGERIARTSAELLG